MCPRPSADGTSAVLCGERADADSLTLARNASDVAALARAVLQTLPRTCTELRLVGGGGGGGGTAECAAPFMYGYGFSFEATWRRRPNTTVDEPPMRRLETDEADAGESADSNQRGRQFDFDVAGALLHQAATSPVCAAQGGYAAWCCTAREACRALLDCLETAATAPPAADDADGDGDEGGGAEGLGPGDAWENEGEDEGEGIGASAPSVDDHDQASPPAFTGDRRRLRQSPVPTAYGRFNTAARLAVVPWVAGIATDDHPSDGGDASQPLSCDRLVRAGGTVSWLLLSDCCSSDPAIANATAALPPGTDDAAAAVSAEGDSYVWTAATDSLRDPFEGDAEADSDQYQQQLTERFRACLADTSFAGTGSEAEAEAEVGWATYPRPALLANASYQATPLACLPPSLALALANDSTSNARVRGEAGPAAQMGWEDDAYLPLPLPPQMPPGGGDTTPAPPPPAHPRAPAGHGAHGATEELRQLEGTSVLLWFLLVYVVLNVMLAAIQAAIDRLQARRYAPSRLF
jgi:hypothetical protein